MFGYTLGNLGTNRGGGKGGAAVRLKKRVKSIEGVGGEKRTETKGEEAAECTNCVEEEKNGGNLQKKGENTRITRRIG